MLSVGANDEPIGLILGHEGSGAADLQPFTVELEPLGCVTRSIERHFDGHPLGRAFQGG